jgi:hypothetical protein
MGLIISSLELIMAFGDTILGKNLQAGLGDTANRLSSAQTMDELFNRSQNPYANNDPIKDKFVYSNSSYSGTDCTVVLQFNEVLLVMGNVQTITYSIFREKAPVRVLGRSHPKGFTVGGRTIAGSMVFTVFDQNPLADIIKQINYVRNPSDRYTSPLGDQLPPLDMIMIFHNEYGHSSIIRMYGVEFTQEGQVHSINDLFTENTMEYVARDIDTMVSYDKIKEFTDMMFARQSRGTFVDNHLASMLDYQRRLQRQIQQINDTITRIDQELGRRTVAGVFSMGLAPLLARGYSQLTTGDSVSRQDLQRQKEKQAQIKQQLLVELEEINRQIRLHEQNIKGWNAQNSQYGTAGRDNLSHQITTPRLSG